MSNASHNNDWLDIIKQHADEATSPVPHDTWAAIEKALAKPQSPQSPPAAGKVLPRGIMWKATAAAAAIALATTTGFFLLHDDKPLQHQGDTIAQTHQPKQEQEPPAAATPAESPLSTTLTAMNTTPASHTAATPSSSHPHRISSPRHSAHAPASPAQHQPEQYYDSEYDDNEPHNDFADFNPEEYFYDIETMQALEELYAQMDNAMNQEAMDPWQSYNDSTYREYLAYDANARRFRREQLIAGDDNSRGRAPMQLQAYGNSLLSGDRTTTSTEEFSGGGSTPMLAPAAPGLKAAKQVAPPVKYDYRHHLPLTFGLTFSRKIVRNLYGNIGLNFTSMSSDVTPEGGAPGFKQRVQLVGLPFGVKWNFWRYRGFSTFVGGEALLERVVDAKFGDESMTIKRLQWSVHATAGAQYNFNRHIGLYVMPKLSHYITTLPLNTLRNEHKFNFNLQMGISVDF